MLKAICLLTPLFAGISTTWAAAAPTQYLTLSQRRIANPEAVNVQAISKDDREMMLSQSRLFLRELYSHLHLKEQSGPLDAAELYSLKQERPPHPYDPFDQLAEVEDHRDPAVWGDPEFHAQMAKAFLNLRDLHTNYFYPKPYACFTNALPFAVEKVYDQKTKQAVASISAITTTPGILNLSPGYKELEIGDILEAYDGKKPLEELATLDLKELGSGANHEAHIRRAVQRLVVRPQQMDPVPADVSDTVTITIRKRVVAPGESPTKTLTFPWISYYTDTTCLGLPADPSVVSPEGFPWIDPAASGKGGAAEASDDFGREFGRLFSKRSTPRTSATPSQLDLTNLLSTAEPSILYKVLVDGNGDSYGYLAITSFEPLKKTTDQSLEIMRGLLTNELAKTNGLIIDVRDNHGGLISYGEEMIQYFTPSAVTPEEFFVRATDENRKFIHTTGAGKYSAWLGLDFPKVEKTITDALNGPVPPDLVDAGVITQPSDANQYGQLYFRPVAVLTNSNCFSTCDMFTAGMQDHQAADIWAVDGQTGGGGANVMNYGTFALVATPTTGPSIYPTLPLGQDFRIAWRQARRVLTHAGQIVEGVGAFGDHGTKEGILTMLRSSPDDLATADHDTLRTIVKTLAKESRKKVASCAIDGGDSKDFRIDQTPVIQAKIAGTEKVTFLQEGKALGSIETSSHSAEAKDIALTLPLKDLASGPTSGSIELVGSSGRDDHRVWRKVLAYRVVPAPTSVSGPEAFDARDGSAMPFTVFNRATPPAAGWNEVMGALHTGLTAQYADYVTTDASLFLDLAQGSKLTLSFNADVDTEKNFDLFTVYAVGVGGAKPIAIVGPLSGKIAANPAQPYMADLSAYAGKAVELRFEFTSDGATEASGVSLRDVRLISQ